MARWPFAKPDESTAIMDRELPNHPWLGLRLRRPQNFGFEGRSTTQQIGQAFHHHIQTRCKSIREQQLMIHGYHVILPHYGFWLPNDPRGSWSTFVARWELARFGRTTRRLEQRTLAQLSSDELKQRETMRAALKYPAVRLTGFQALSVANGFRSQSLKCRYQIWALSILPEHTHVVVARHKYRVEQVTNLLKGAATGQLLNDNRHPLESHAAAGERPPSMWARRCWKVFLDSNEAIENAIAYVIDNPVKEGKPPQNWQWLTPFSGLDTGWTTYRDQ